MSAETMDLSGHVTLRPPSAEDVAFVFDSWLMSYRSGKRGPRLMAPIYFSGQRATIQRVLQRSSVLLACNTEDPSQVFGWIVSEALPGNGAAIHYVYVKQMFRRLGVAKRLLRAAIGDATTVQHSHETRDWEKVPGSSVFNPYLAGVAQ